MRWTKIFLAENELDAASIKGFLEANNLKVQIVPKSSASIIQGPEFHTGALVVPYEIFVPEKDQEQAKELLSSTNQIK